MSEDKLREIAAGRFILDAKKQRVVWARLTAIKRLLIRHGLVTHEEFEEMASAMVRDIDSKVLENLKKELGADDDIPDYEETVQEEADRLTDCEP